MDTSFLFKVSLGHCPVRMRWDNEKIYAVLRLRRGHAPNPRAGTSATICSTRALHITWQQLLTAARGSGHR